MAYNLRLPAALDADARTRCERLGISLNALLCIAVDAYLRTDSGQAIPSLQARDSPGQAGPEPAAAVRFVAEPSVPGQPVPVPQNDIAERARAFPKLSKAERRDITARERLARKGKF